MSDSTAGSLRDLQYTTPGAATGVGCNPSDVTEDIAPSGQPQGTTELPPSGIIDGAVLLDEVDSYLCQYVIYPNSQARHAHVLWIAHTHLMDCWESTPRIAFLSPEPASGKTRALEATEPLVPRPVHAVNVTSAYLFRKISALAGLPTVLYDEIDTVFGRGKENEEVRGLINAGHRKGAVAGRCAIRGDNVVTEELPAYCAVMMAGLRDLPDTIMTRTIAVRMKKRAPSETVRPWRHRVDAPIGRALGVRLTDWADGVRERIAQRWPEMPAGVDDRDADTWEPLLSIADMAGGHWPESARVAAVAAVADTARREPSLGVLLLRDIKALYAARLDQNHLMTAELVMHLNLMEESPWASIRRDGGCLDVRFLAKLLDQYGITSCNIREATGKVRKGHYRSDFSDAWERYLPPDDYVDGTPHPLEPPVSAITATSATEHLEESSSAVSGSGMSTPSDSNQIQEESSVNRYTPDPRPNACGRCRSIPCRCGGQEQMSLERTGSISAEAAGGQFLVEGTPKIKTSKEFDALVERLKAEAAHRNNGGGTHRTDEVNGN